jgi:hypothetical protein
MASEFVSQNNPTPDAGGKPDVQPNDPTPNISPTLSVPSPPPAKTHCEVTCKTEKNWWDKFKPFVEMGGVILLAVYTGYTIKIYCVNRRAADIAASQLDLSTRAWIGVLPSGTVTDPLTYPDGPNKPVFKVQYILKNYGHSPAFVTVEGKVFDLSQSGGWRDVQHKFCDPKFAEAKSVGRAWGEGSYTMVPEGELPFNLVEPMMINGPETIRVSNVGCVMYRSIADNEPRMTTFVADISGSKGESGKPEAIKLDGQPIPSEELKVLGVRTAGEAK